MIGVLIFVGVVGVVAFIGMVGLLIARLGGCKDVLDVDSRL